ncbi:hypothetical protein, variant [Aphanomyces astaci]|uniref:Uncharacterized protein n=1 Tax=Aphanomyces astaci TaxID=112090 RepID=W4HBQ2_APHAT|nr:hypothetical protein, variant [Aphanomyces astaci]ETV88694.1 hypothetical protein, variant [Aphanomyces astaci]|eukprot:XP_009821094.1 hypothetical protein, variant [Aphanomyces astaci]
MSRDGMLKVAAVLEGDLLSLSSLELSRGMKRSLRGRSSLREPPTSEYREKRRLQDRLRKRRSKEVAHLEAQALKDEVRQLEAQLKRMKAREPSSTNYLAKVQALQAEIARAYEEQHRLRHTLVHEVEKGIVYQSLSWQPSESEMVLDPRRDPWMMHSFPADPAAHDQALRGIMTQQLCKLTPELYSRLPMSAEGRPFSIVLDDVGQDIAFLEMRKYSLMRADSADVAHSIFRNYTFEAPSSSSSSDTQVPALDDPNSSHILLVARYVWQ